MATVSIDILTRDEVAGRYLARVEQQRYTLYPVQEEALLAWFTSEQGVLVCAPTGTGKTLIAQAALFEALHTGKTAYYTTPLIALTDQKFQEMQACAVRWGFPPDSVGLVTGSRRVNPNATVLVVVAEILLNRLLNQAAFDFDDVSACVMDEFHNFADLERGIVWEMSLALLPRHVRLLLLSATVGNAAEFVSWLARCHDRKLELVETDDRRVPLSYEWVPDRLLSEHLIEMARGDTQNRKTPALVFCFNRDECWSIAEVLKGKDLVLSAEQKARLHAEVGELDWTRGAGPTMKRLLHRGVGVHHAGLLPKYRRVVEDLFERKLLAVVVCTETLAAGINLPARSVVLSTLVKGPHGKGKQKLVDASTAHQIFGRAGRPQYDDHGYIYALAHEDDVRILRWKEEYDAIPEQTGDPGLLKAKKALKKKKPSRRETVQYWSEGQFRQLQSAPPGKLYSKGPMPWRLLAYMLEISPDVARIRALLRKRLMDEPRIKASDRALDEMLLSLAAGGFVTLDPVPPGRPSDGQPPPPYSPTGATPTPALSRLRAFRSVHPLYGAFLVSQLGVAGRDERLQAMESVLRLPGPLLKCLRVPPDLPPGTLAVSRLDPELIRRGLLIAPVDNTSEDEEEEDEPREERPPALADKLRLYFDALYPDVTDVSTQSLWCAGGLLEFGGNFDAFVKDRNLVKQEGIVFRHLLRLILLCGEFALVCPPDTSDSAWRADLREMADRLTASCQAVDPTSTKEMIGLAHAADAVDGEAASPAGVQ
jgi:superfamily II DNA/RNA helicase